MKQPYKRLLKTALKIGLTIAALTLVINKIELDEVWKLAKTAHPGFLLLAFVFFNLSKLLSSIRLNTYFSAPPLLMKLSWLYSLRLYYVGMFYNLFLPGGIGGDGYKVIVLNKYEDKPIKQLIAVSLLDRINGLVSLLFCAFIIGCFVPVALPEGWSLLPLLLLLLTLLIYPIFGLFERWFFSSYHHFGVFFKTNTLSLGVQSLQLICVLFILLALGETSFLPYMLLFLASSIVAVLPLTIGGVGARELVFILGHEYVGITVEAAVALSMLFFIITVLGSLSGVFLSAKPSR